MHRPRPYRLQLQVRIGIRGKDKSGRDFQERCPTVNVSRGGACLLANRHIPPGTTLAISVSGEIDGRAQVVWAERGHDIEPHRLGIKFLEMKEWIVK